MSHGVTLGWIGSSVAVYADDDPLWQQLAEVSPDKLNDFFEKNAWRLPVGVRIGVSNGLRLTAFLAAFRAPTSINRARHDPLGIAHVQGAALREDHAHAAGQGSGKDARKRGDLLLCLGRRAAGHAQRKPAKAGDRPATGPDKLPSPACGRGAGGEGEGDETALKSKGTASPSGPSAADVATTAPAWLGSNVALRVDRRVWELLSRLHRDDYQRTMQSRAWSNLPILNEWKRHYPDQDPVAIHQRVWKIGLLCPGGGRYVWNEKFQTMESTVYGHPGEPKLGPAAPPALMDFARGAFGLTFENQGLRARAVVGT